MDIGLVVDLEFLDGARWSCDTLILPPTLFTKERRISSYMKVYTYCIRLHQCVWMPGRWKVVCQEEGIGTTCYLPRIL
jgi:hypothetical protein